MPQHRIHNYGQTATSQWENVSLYTTQDKGVYRGMDLGVDSTSNLTIAPGYAVMISTIGSDLQSTAFYETTAITLSFLPPGAATNYTVVATHNNRQILGGVSIEYAVRSGLLTTVTDGIIVGWIYHPGGGVALTADHLLSAPKLLTGDYAANVAARQPLDLLAPFPQSYLETVDPNVTVATAWDAVLFTIYQSASNASLVGAELARQMVQYYADDDRRPVSFDLYVNIDTSAGTSLTVELYGTDQSIVTTTGGPFAGTGLWQEISVVVDKTDGVFTAGQPYTLRLTQNLALGGGTIRIARIKANYWPYPA